MFRNVISPLRFTYAFNDPDMIFFFFFVLLWTVLNDCGVYSPVSGGFEQFIPNTGFSGIMS